MNKIEDWIRNQDIGFTIQRGHTATLLLGYQDDNYPDNGYSRHDDGTENQCLGVGGAAVEVTITHH